MNRHRFPGMDINARLSRHYPYGKTAAHAGGLCWSESIRSELAVIDVKVNYRGTTHIGKTGSGKIL